MASLEWKDLIGMSASVWTILQMLSPLPSCYHFITTKTVGDMIVTPYVVALTSCSLWLFYGFIIGDSTIMRVNMIGFGLQFSYTLCYYTYCLKKVQVRQQLALGLCVILAVMMYTQLETDFKRLISVLGFFCSCVTILFFASPLANMNLLISPKFITYQSYYLCPSFLLFVTEVCLFIHSFALLLWLACFKNLKFLGKRNVYRDLGGFLPDRYFQHYVIKIWNSESLPRLLIVTTFIVSVQWAVYGCLIQDGYILVTNLSGTVLSCFQLALILIIPRETSPKLISNI